MWEKDKTAQHVKVEWNVSGNNYLHPLDHSIIRNRKKKLQKKKIHVVLKTSRRWTHRFWTILFTKKARIQLHVSRESGSPKGNNSSVSVVQVHIKTPIYVWLVSLLYSMLCIKTGTLKTESFKGTKVNKERITTLVCANVCSEKIPLCVVQKSKQPHCSNSIRSLPHINCPIKTQG